MALILLFGGLSIVFGLAFLFFKMEKPQSLWLAITFLGFVFHLMVVFVVFLVQEDFQTPLFILGLGFLLFMGLMPVLMLGTFLVNGIRIIRYEGFKFKNTLSLVVGIGLIVYLFIWPALVDVSVDHILNTIYQFISFSTFYLSVILVLYTVTNLLNLVHWQQVKIDYFIVLGAGLIGDQVPPILASRINKGLELQAAQNSGKIVFSGGQGDDELISEGEAMSRYALDQGTDSQVVLKETKSRNTRQNIHFSKEIIDADWSKDFEPKIAIVTNNYHVLRAVMQARKAGIKAIGYGAKTKFYYSLNAFLREFVAYLQMTYKLHGTVIGLAGIFLFGLFFLVMFLS